MSKKKNTLKDLDAFLKQQAATLVSPQRITPQKEDMVTVLEVEEEHAEESNDEVSLHTVLKDLRALSSREGNRFRSQFYDLIIKTVENQKEISPEDRMLINTALYLKSGDNWKETIREYWRVRS